VSIKKNLNGVRLVLLIVFFVVVGLPYLCTAADNCIECHKDKKFRVQNKKLYDYYSKWVRSSHDIAGITCVDCHGGEPTEKDKDAAHKNGFSSPNVSGEAFYKEIPQTCGSSKCHDSVLQNFTKSKHFKALQKEGKGPHCATCHGSVNSNVYYTSIVAKTCEACHNEETKNHPEVTKFAEKILQRLNVSRAYRNWVVIFYSDKDPIKLKEVNALYGKVADSWHKFNFLQLDEKSQELLTTLKSMVHKGIAEKKKKIKEK